MATDPFTSGLDPEFDYALVGPHPVDPQVGETFNVWLHDGARDIGINLHPSLKEGTMFGMATVFLPDGRILRGMSGPASFTDPASPASEHLHYHCDEPFHRWTYRVVDLPMFVTNDEEQATAEVPLDRAPTVNVSAEITANTDAPAWIQGALLPEALEMMKGPAGLWIGGRLPSGMHPSSTRYDQALSGTGTITVDGTTYELAGSGLRGHVRGVRIMDGYHSHTWMGGAFPSGRAFGLLTQGRDDGGFAFSEAYVYQDGQMHGTRVLHRPPIEKRVPKGRFVLELACDELGLTRITGNDDRLFYWAMNGWGAAGGLAGYGLGAPTTHHMSQALASFDWDGETGYGMDERSG